MCDARLEGKKIQQRTICLICIDNVATNLEIIAHFKQKVYLQSFNLTNANYAIATRFLFIYIRRYHVFIILFSVKFKFSFSFHKS